MTHHLAHYVATVVVGLTTFLICLLSLLFYFAPTFYAFHRNVKYRWGVFALNLLTAWTLIGWFAVAIWAHHDRAEPRYPSHRS